MMKRHSETGRLIMTAAMAGFLLWACSAPPSSTPVGSGTTATSGKPYGSLVVGWSETIGVIAPGDIIGGNYGGFAVAVFDSLVTLDSGGNVAPGLAERWEISDDGLTHTFYLRKGVKFHDGSDLTAADVKFSMDRLLSREATSALQSVTTWRAMAPRVDIKDDYTVAVNFKMPEFGLPKSIIDFSGGPATIVPKKYIEAKGVEYFRKNPVGSGPWKVVTYLQGQRIELESNEGYWDANLVPKFKNLTIVSVGEETTKAAMLKTGELDMADISPESAANLKVAGLRIRSWNGGQQANYALLYDTENPAPYAFSDVRVRKATSLALNRQEMGDKLFGGYAKPGILNRVQPTFDFFDANVLKPDPYDPEGAKKLLAEAGYANGFDTRIWDQGAGGILSTFSQALAGYWRRVGINGTLEPIERAALVDLLRNYSAPRRSNTIYTAGIGSAPATSTVGFDIASPFHSTKAVFRNQTNKRLTDLIDQYPLTKDPTQRRAIAREAVILAMNEYTSISVLEVSAIWALGSKIGDLTPIEGQGQIGAAYATITHAK